MFAVNNYRANGGGNFPHVAAAQQLWSNSDEIRNTIIGVGEGEGRDRPGRVRVGGLEAHARRHARVLDGVPVGGASVPARGVSAVAWARGTCGALAACRPKVVNAVRAGSG